MTVGDRIRKQRELAGITQTDLANMVKVSKQTLNKYEKNTITNIPSDKIEEIAKVLNISPAYLMGWEDNLNSFEDGSSKPDFIVDLLSNNSLTEHVKKLQLLNGEHQQTIFDNIDYWYDKEGH
ncbi:MAG: helix-turn-helix transcriptional regulator [Lachnospiraceae bacterium]|nr:helix-turn-helix transcriptional regulator [Lachnospiraceae bacterium]